MEQMQYSDAWKNAQNYEARTNNGWQQHNAQNLLNHLNKNKNENAISWFSEEIWLEEFFNSSKEEFLKFNDEIKEKTNLEIGAGPFGFLQGLYWLKNRITIEPLLNSYKNAQLEYLGESWYVDETQTFYSQPAEIFIPELENKIDGFIMCRNTLDHTQDWRKILDNISRYSSVGSYFLLWTDLYHAVGPDEGHFNITSDVDYFKKIIENLGYEIIREYRNTKRADINFGCVAKKIK